MQIISKLTNRIRTAYDNWVWENQKNGLCTGIDVTHNMDGTPNPTKEKTLRTVLDNTHKYLRSQTEWRGRSDMIGDLIISATRLMMPRLLANEIVGVQPMTGPVSTVYTLRQRKTEQQNPRSFVIKSECAASKTRKFMARYGFSANDSVATQPKELVEVIATELVAEYDLEILSALRALAGAPSDGDPNTPLADRITQAATDIGTRTRRSAGNWAIISPTALVALKDAPTFKMKTAAYMGSVAFVGTLNDTIRVYVNPYANESDPVLVGLKENEFDSAAVFAPYIPVTSSGAMIDPNTFDPVVSFMTRFSYLEFEECDDFVGNSAQYVSAISMEQSP